LESLKVNKLKKYLIALLAGLSDLLNLKDIFKFEDSRFRDLKILNSVNLEDSVDLEDTITTLLIGSCWLLIDNYIVDCWLSIVDWKKQQTAISKKQETIEMNLVDIINNYKEVCI